jgi:hypothetical protein
VLGRGFYKPYVLSTSLSHTSKQSTTFSQIIPLFPDFKKLKGSGPITVPHMHKMKDVSPAYLSH